MYHIPNQSNTVYAPMKPVLKIPTMTEAEWVLELSRRHYQKHHKSLLPVMEGNIVGYGLLGSSVYGLHHPDSDRDVLIITDAPKNRDFNHVFSNEGVDVRITSIFNLAHQLLEGIPSEVDLHASGLLTIRNPYKSYYNAIRFNQWRYLDRIHRHARSDVSKAFSNKKSSDRVAKSLKTALRGFVMSHRYRNEHHSLPRTLFTNAERENFYRELYFLEEVLYQNQHLTENIAIQLVAEAAERI
jgi:hypothetical protein